MSQALHHHYPLQHFSNNVADVFADVAAIVPTEVQLNSFGSDFIVMCGLGWLYLD